MSNEEIKNTENSQADTENAAESTTNEATEQVENTAEETPKAEDTKTEEAPTEETTQEEATEEPKAEEAAEEKTEAPATEENADDSETEDKTHYNEVVASLEKKIGTEETVNVEVIAKAKGGLRVVYDSVPLFLPASHYTLEKKVNEEKLDAAVGQNFDVKVTEVKQIGEGKIVIVSRKDMLLKEVWDKVEVGAEVTGNISSITNFGVFIDLGGVEGLVHVSRLSHAHIDNPKNHYNKGDEMTVKVIEIDKKNGKISLSRKALEDSPWKGAEEKYKVGETVTGKVKRLTNFGAYVELEPGVEGLLRVSELSWAMRVDKPADVLSEGQEVELKVLQISEEKGQAALSLKQNTENPWASLTEKYSKGSDASGVVQRVFDKGAIVRINDEVDAFMPVSRMNALKENEDDQPLKVGQALEVKVIDAAANDESLVVSPVLTEEQREKLNAKKQKRNKGPKGRPTTNVKTSAGSVSFGDLLSNSDLKNLTNEK
ncbi:MAG: S1 RNA-binding domain-containing protein [Chlorobiota bacterium]